MIVEKKLKSILLAKKKFWNKQNFKNGSKILNNEKDKERNENKKEKRKKHLADASRKRLGKQK